MSGTPCTERDRSAPPRLYRPEPEPESDHRPRGLLADDPPSAAITRWSIGGWTVGVRTWTAEEWARLDGPPEDAQPFGNGAWGLLWVE